MPITTICILLEPQDVAEVEGGKGEAAKAKEEVAKVGATQTEATEQAG